MDAGLPKPIAHNSYGGGKQYSVIAISGGAHSGEYLAFGLLPAAE